MKFISLQGLVPYEAARKLQHGLVERRAADEIEDTILFLEHEPVVTRGRGLQWTGEDKPRAMPLGPLPATIAFSESERGGDLTYHGPGQLVIYPIVKLDGSTRFTPARDIAKFLRTFEEVVIEDLRALGLAAGMRENATGVWVGDRKLASMGIAVRRWIVYHGMAVNVVNDLGPYQFISPCGFASEVMTNLLELMPHEEALREDSWRAWYEARLSAAIGNAAGIREAAPIEKADWRDLVD